MSEAQDPTSKPEEVPLHHATGEVELGQPPTPLPQHESPPDRRRFFPRVKHLVTADYQAFLSVILDCLESSGAPHTPVASHKDSNSWFRAFHAIYGGVAANFSQPTGKNRYHKFKDKIVELWHAMERDHSHPYHAIAVNQLRIFQNVVRSKQSGTPVYSVASPSPPSASTPGPVTATAQTPAGTAPAAATPAATVAGAVVVAAPTAGAATTAVRMAPVDLSKTQQPNQPYATPNHQPPMHDAYRLHGHPHGHVHPYPNSHPRHMLPAHQQAQHPAHGVEHAAIMPAPSAATGHHATPGSASGAKRPTPPPTAYYPVYHAPHYPQHEHHHHQANKRHAIASPATNNGAVGTNGASNPSQYGTGGPSLFSNAARHHGNLPNFIDDKDAFECLPSQLQQLLHLRLFRARVEMSHSPNMPARSTEDESLEKSYQHALRSYLTELQLPTPEMDLWSGLQGLILLWKCSKELGDAVSAKSKRQEGDSSVNSDESGEGEVAMTSASLAEEGKMIWASYQTLLAHYIRTMFPKPQSTS